MKKLFLFLLLIPGFLLPSAAQQPYNISYLVKGLRDDTVFLASVYGSRYIPADTCLSVNGLIRFSGTRPAAPGVYRIIFDDSLFTDVIVNNQEIVLENNMEDLFLNLVVRESEENRIYYDYWKMSLIINDSIDLIADMGNAIYKANKGVMTHDLDSMARKAAALSAKLKKFTDGLIVTSKGMYVNKLLLAYSRPDWNEYKKQAGARAYKSNFEFLSEHFFDNVDFADSTLLHSEVFYTTTTNYLTQFVANPSDASYSRACDLILLKASACKPVFDYILRLLINTFDNTEYEGTFVHLVDDYLMQNTCEPGSREQSLRDRAAAIRRLAPGNKASDFPALNTSGAVTSLYSIEAPVMLLLFWNSECAHCEEAMPQIVAWYHEFRDRGLKVVAFATDTDKNKWLEAVKKNRMEWINLSDLKGYNSPAVANYNAYSTPAFFILGKDKTILAHPYSPKELYEGLKMEMDKSGN